YKKITAHNDNCGRYRHRRVAPHLLLAMKLSVILSLVCCLHVSASTFAQRVTLTTKQAALADVLQSIKSQTGYHLFYDSQAINGAKPVTVTLRDATREEALSVSLRGQQLGYEIVDKNIIITRGSATPVVATPTAPLPHSQ